MPDPDDVDQQVAFGTSGHRGQQPRRRRSTRRTSLATTQAICDYRREQGYDGPLFIGRDTHGLSEPAWATALEVLVANDVTVLVDDRRRLHADPGGLARDPARQPGQRTRRRAGRRHRGHAVAQPARATAASSTTRRTAAPPTPTPPTWIADARQRAASRPAWTGVQRIPFAAGARPARTAYDFLGTYVDDLPNVVDLDAISDAGVRIGADPLGGASVDYWGEIAERHGLDLTVVNPLVDPTWRFMTLDWDGKIRMDCSSPQRDGVADRPQGRVRDRHRQRRRRRPARHRHPRRRADEPQPLPRRRDRLPLRRRPARLAGDAADRQDAGVVLDDRPGRRRRSASELVEVPVGFKWFVPGLIDGSFGFGGEESAGASFLRRDGSTWTTDKDGILLALLASEILATTGKTPERALRRAGRAARRPGVRPGRRPGRPRRRRPSSAALSPDDVTATELAGEEITAKLTEAPGNGAKIGGLKVTTENAWFAARPSGTEDVYKIYAESFRGPDHLAEVQEAAREVVSAALGG